MIIPYVVDWPEMLFCKHLFDAFSRRRLRPRPGFGIKTESASVLFVFVPVIRSDVVIRTSHFDCGRSAYFARERFRRGKDRPAWVDSRKFCAFTFLKFRIWQHVAADSPDKNARVVSKPQHLIV